MWLCTFSIPYGWNILVEIKWRDRDEEHPFNEFINFVVNAFGFFFCVCVCVCAPSLRMYGSKSQDNIQKRETKMAHSKFQCIWFQRVLQPCNQFLSYKFHNCKNAILSVTLYNICVCLCVSPSHCFSVHIIWLTALHWVFLFLSRPQPQSIIHEYHQRLGEKCCLCKQKIVESLSLWRRIYLWENQSSWWFASKIAFFFCLLI